jgi:AAA ATPase domain
VVVGEITARTGSRPTTAATVGDRLEGARRRAFVGRTAELELFRGALEDPDAFSVLWVHGPGGVGKTALVGALAEAAGDAGLEAIRIDLRSIEPAPPAFTAELARAMGLPAGSGPLEALGDRDRPVLLLDTFEQALGLEDWLREDFIPALPAGALTAIAGRTRPAEAWRRDPGWRDLLRVVSLRNLEPDDARAILAGAGVADDLHEPAVELTHGHPLALWLLLDVLSQRQEAGGGAPLELEAVPDVVGRLVASFVAEAPTARHRLALDAAAQARFATEGLLREVLGDEEGEEMFAWLRGLSFVESAPRGLVLHDLARDVIGADLRWRDRDAYARVHGLVRRNVVERLTGSEGLEQQQALADLMFLHRGNPAALVFWDWESLGHVYADALRPADRESIIEMVARHEGAESAAIAAHWLGRQPGAFAVFRGRGVEPLGFLAQLALHEADEDDLARDPGARAAWEHAMRHGPPRPGEAVVAGRFFMDRDAYQAPSRSFNVVTMRCTQEWLIRPRLSWYYLTPADPETMAPLMAYIHFGRAPTADFEVGGRSYGAFARDWRRENVLAWLDRMGERELGGGLDVPARPPEAAPELALSRVEFADAVRRGLRDLHRPQALAENPLLRARAVREACGERPPPEALADLLERAVDAMRADPRDAKLLRALDRTYLRPAPTQEAAAELLGLPFSTYRGHLTRGIERVVDWLWQRELYGPERP